MQSRILPFKATLGDHHYLSSKSIFYSFFQLSHEYEQLTGDNYSQLSSSSMTSTGDDTSAGLKRWQSDETLYATPIIYADPTTGKQQQQQKQANSPMHGHNNRMAAMIKLAAVERQRIAEETEDEVVVGCR